ncbi:MAG: FtsX-like permease family protein [Bryobacteraceae bacterium]
MNESMVKKYFAGQNPIGMRFSYGETYRAERSFEIVGVVKDARYFGLREATQPMIYQPIWRPGAGSRALCIRTSADPQYLMDAVRREASAIDSTVPMLTSRTMEQYVDTNLVQEKMVATLSGFFGVLALLLASVGLYGVMAQGVTRRTREIGIRIALGARSSSVLWLVMKEALLVVAIGAAIGIPAALAVTRFASTFLYGIGARDPLSTASATLILAAVAFFAAYLPARRASRLDPNLALRYE